MQIRGCREQIGKRFEKIVGGGSRKRRGEDERKRDGSLKLENREDFFAPCHLEGVYLLQLDYNRKTF
jgi:hypothetical protein